MHEDVRYLLSKMDDLKAEVDGAMHFSKRYLIWFKALLLNYLTIPVVLKLKVAYANLKFRFSKQNHWNHSV